MQRKGTRNKRRGLQKVSCLSCGASVYITWAQAEQHGLPVCSCGEGFEPDDMELAMALGLDGAASVLAYRHEIGRIEQGRKGSGKWGEDLRLSTAKSRDGRLSVEELAAQRVEKDRSARALGARLNALKPVAEAMPF